MKIRVGDLVLVTAGKDKGKTGSVMRVLDKTERLVIEGVNMRTKHVRKTPQQAGQKVRYEASIHISNVMIVDPKTKKPTRVRYERDPKNNRKKRVAVRSGEEIKKTTKAAVLEKEDEKKKAADKKSTKKSA